MITVQELHIAFREGLNQIASFQGDEYLEDEVDRYLTRGQIALITEMYKGYTQKQQYANEMSKLEVINYQLPVYYPTSTENIYFTHKDFNFGYIVPPPNYMYSLNIKPFIKGAKLCDVNYVQTNTTVTEYVAIVPFNSQLIGNENLDFIVSNNDIPLLSLASYNLPTINNEDDKFYFIQVVLEEINRRNENITGNAIINNPANTYTLGDVQIYWETYRNMYYPNSFIFVSSNEDYLGNYMEIKIDSTSSTSYTSDDSITDYIINEEKARGEWYSISYNTKDSTGVSFEDTAVAREVDKKKAIELLDNPLQTPKRDKPHVVHSNGYIWIHTPKDAIATKVYFDYIRYPKPISLRLQWHSELDKLLAQDLVNRAVQFAMTESSDPKIQTKVQIDKYDL